MTAEKTAPAESKKNEPMQWSNMMTGFIVIAAGALMASLSMFAKDPRDLVVPLLFGGIISLAGVFMYMHFYCKNLDELQKFKTVNESLDSMSRSICKTAEMLQQRLDLMQARLDDIDRHVCEGFNAMIDSES